MSPTAENEKWMRRCLFLAACGRAGAPPNPMVGAVVVHGDRILGEGYHVRCGGPHAEVNAINAVRPSERALLPASTLYVNLEPCSHYGRTPPCAELIIRTGIRRVVVGCEDPFARVRGRGIRMLREAGVEVIVGVLEAECRQLNRRFITFHTRKRPYITLKWACSSDGFLDRWRENEVLEESGERREESENYERNGSYESNGSNDRPIGSISPITPIAPSPLPSPAPLSSLLSPLSSPITLSTPHTLMRVHRLRASHQAILVGHNTLRLDRPSLTVRHWWGQSPLRLVLGRVAEGELPAGFEAFADIDTMLASLYGRGVQSLLVEGGSQTLQAFIDRGLWDEAWEELSSVRLGSGVPIPRMPVGVPRQAEECWGVSISHWSNVVE